MDSERLRALFKDLRDLEFDPHDKPSRHENLTDLLEIAAVAAGLKPAHLNGHGFRSDTLLQNLGRLASRHGLLAVETNALRPHRGRAPHYQAAILHWQIEREREEAIAAPTVLWIHSDPAVSILIDRAVRGETNVSAILGYPECCVTEKNESDLALYEQYVEALRKKYHPSTVGALIELIQRNTKAEIEPARDIWSAVRQTRLRFPYLQLNACAACLKTDDSASARLNEAMKTLALALDSSFAAEVEVAARDEGRLSTTSASTLQIDPKVEKTGRNAPCPCGSGKKYKKCHG